MVRQLGKPALLAATYKGDAAGIAAAAMEEVEATLVNCLHELERLSLISGGVALLHPVRSTDTAAAAGCIVPALDVLHDLILLGIGIPSAHTIPFWLVVTDTTTHCAGDHEPMKADWAHVFLSVLPPLPLAAAKDETRIALALKAACAGVMARLYTWPLEYDQHCS